MSPEDLVFVSFCAYIFEKRTTLSPNDDKFLEDVSSYLKQLGVLQVNVDPCVPCILRLEDQNASFIIALLNAYLPDFPLVIILTNERNTKTNILKNTLHVRSPSLIRFEIDDISKPLKPFQLTHLHGGKIEIVGFDLDFESVVDILQSYPAKTVFSTDINVTGTLDGCTPEALARATDILLRIIGETPDYSLFEFSLCARFTQDFDDFDDIPLNVKIRSWTITFSVDGQRCCLKASKDSSKGF